VSALFDQERLATAMSKLLSDTLDANNLEFGDIDKKSDSLFFSFKSNSYVVTLDNYEVKKLNALVEQEENQFQSKSPDGQWVAYVYNYNLFIKSATSKDSFQLTFDGQKNFENASYYGWFDKMEGENGDRPQRFSVSWSPDSKFLRANLVDLRNASKMYMLDFSQEDLYRPALYSYYRGSPGDTNMVYIKPKIFDIATKKEIKLDLPRRTHINSMNLRWAEESGVIIAADTERGFQKITLSLIDAKTGSQRQLLVEESKTNLDNFWFHYLEKHNKILFLSQRSGWRQMYQLDIETGHVSALTKGDFVINEVVTMDEETGDLWLTASGVDPEMNPYHQQIFRLALDGKMTLLTPEPLHHQASFSPDRKYLIDNYSDVKTPTKTVLRSAFTGEVLTLVAEANIDRISEMGWEAPMTFTLTGKDGKTPIYGAIWRPIDFDPSKKYPIIDHTYTGPHTQVFPKSFTQAFGNQSLAELGFLVIMVDGLGTAGRSKAFLNHSYKNMGANLEDHVLAIKQLAEKHAWIDAEKVGIFGHSAGGYDAGHGMLAFPDFYKVGVASSADHDFRMEKAWWPEMYMGWPVDSTYHEVSNITMASNLKGKLLLVHGNMDDNVNASATYKLSEALVKADKEFDLLILPSQRHGYQGDYRKYFNKKRWNYFVEHLLHVEPVWDFQWD
jgi:dipeptidyl aminopeptidase/acylaminoacyl peptidase